MTPPVPTLYYDFIDPLSWLLARECAGLDEVVEAGLRSAPLELRPPPTPLTTLEDPDLAKRWRTARVMGTALGLDFRPPPLVPWTRKAHELVLHAATEQLDLPVRERLFEVYLLDGLDVGRVDVLVDVAGAAGLDRTEAKAVLDVDRYREDVVALRRQALEAGIRTVPTLLFEGRTLEGFHNRAAIRTFLGT
jgi:predicted DsbA family dithiol-disulfide isomerase